MITKEIILCGKPVTLGYCYATEISYKILAEEEISDYFAEIYAAFQQKRDPDVRKSIYLIHAAMNAYADSKEIEPPLTNKELLEDLSPQERGTAIGTMIVLRNEFYKVPVGEPEDKTEKEGGSEKNS